MDDAFDELDLVLPGDEDLQKGKRALRTKLCQIFGFTGGEKMVRKQASSFQMLPSLHEQTRESPLTPFLVAFLDPTPLGS
eukprot:6121795-Amphidinium_carterae.1